MNDNTYGKLLELDFKTRTDYNNPFADIDVNCTFISPSKREVSIPAFYDGSSTWRGAFSGLCVMNDFENDKEKLLDWVLVLGAKE